METVDLHSKNSREVRRTIDACPGKKINTAIGNLNVSIQILAANSNELKSALRSFEEPQNAVNFFLNKKRDDMELFMMHVRRFLHNYLSSVKSCVDTNRVVIRELYSGQPFLEEYNQRVQESFARDPLAQFIQNLRNYALHRSIPITSATLTIQRGEQPESAVLLLTEPLKKSDIWNPTARRWLESASESEPLLPMIEAYDTIAQDFCAWLDQRQKVIHESDISEWLELESRYAELRQSGG